jgi:hypothetical protein
MKAKPVPTPAVNTPKGVEHLNPSIGDVRAKEFPPVKTSGIKVRGGKAQTKGFMARGPMA